MSAENTRSAVEHAELLTGFILFVDVVKHNPRVAYILALGFVRAAEKMANGRPLTDPNRPDAVAHVVEQMADAFLEAVPTLTVSDPTPTTKA